MDTPSHDLGRIFNQYQQSPPPSITREGFSSPVKQVDCDPNHYGNPAVLDDDLHQLDQRISDEIRNIVVQESQRLIRSYVQDQIQQCRVDLHAELTLMVDSIASALTCVRSEAATNGNYTEKTSEEDKVIIHEQRLEAFADQLQRVWEALRAEVHDREQAVSEVKRSLESCSDMWQSLRNVIRSVSDGPHSESQSGRSNGLLSVVALRPDEEGLDNAKLAKLEADRLPVFSVRSNNVYGSMPNAGTRMPTPMRSRSASPLPFGSKNVSNPSVSLSSTSRPPSPIAVSRTVPLGISHSVNAPSLAQGSALASPLIQRSSSNLALAERAGKQQVIAKHSMLQQAPRRPATAAIGQARVVNVNRSVSPRKSHPAEFVKLNVPPTSVHL